MVVAQNHQQEIIGEGRRVGNAFSICVWRGQLRARRRIRRRFDLSDRRDLGICGHVIAWWGQEQGSDGG